MGGKEQQPLWPADRIQVGDLVHRYESSDKPEKHYSDEYSKKRLEEQKKQMDQLMNALSRLGIIDQLAPQGMVPRMPYRPMEEEFGF